MSTAASLLLEHSITVISFLFDTYTPVTEKSLKDFNHKWIAADTSVPDGVKKISIYINEGKIL